MIAFFSRKTQIPLSISEEELRLRIRNYPFIAGTSKKIPYSKRDFPIAENTEGIIRIGYGRLAIHNQPVIASITFEDGQLLLFQKPNYISLVSMLLFLGFMLASAFTHLFRGNIHSFNFVFSFSVLYYGIAVLGFFLGCRKMEKWLKKDFFTIN